MNQEISHEAISAGIFTRKSRIHFKEANLAINVTDQRLYLLLFGGVLFVLVVLLAYPVILSVVLVGLALSAMVN